MLVSHKHKFIFIHIYKTAGTSITQRLLPYSRMLDQVAGRYVTRHLIYSFDRAFNLLDQGDRWLLGVGKHGTATETKAYLGEARYSHYFSFSFVRNPWDWMCSQYYYIRRWRLHRDHERVIRMTFLEFLRFQVDQATPTQSKFLTDATGDIIVNYVGRFESLEADFLVVARALGLSFQPLPHLNCSDQRGDYERVYDTTGIELVSSYFKEDIERFGYEFGLKNGRTR